LVARRTAQDRYIGVNAGQTQHTGIEAALSMEFRPSMGAFIHPFVQYSWSFHTFVDFEDRGEEYTGNRVTGVPPHVLNVGVDFKMPLVQGTSTEERDRLSLSGNINGRWVSAMPIRDNNSVYSTDYFVVGARLGLQYVPIAENRLQFQVFAGVDNALNAAYAGMLLVNAGSFGGNAPRYYYPGLPRNAYVGLQVDF
jgi:iron complex outermembrane receptor protein